MKIITMIQRLLIFMLFECLMLVFAQKKDFINQSPTNYAKLANNFNELMDEKSLSLSSILKKQKPKKEPLYLNKIPFDFKNKKKNNFTKIINKKKSNLKNKRKRNKHTKYLHKKNNPINQGKQTSKLAINQSYINNQKYQNNTISLPSLVNLKQTILNNSTFPNLNKSLINQIITPISEVNNTLKIIASKNTKLKKIKPNSNKIPNIFKNNINDVLKMIGNLNKNQTSNNSKIHPNFIKTNKNKIFIIAPASKINSNKTLKKQNKLNIIKIDIKKINKNQTKEKIILQKIKNGTLPNNQFLTFFRKHQNNTNLEESKKLPLSEAQLLILKNVNKNVAKKKKNEARLEELEKKLNFFPFRKLDYKIYLEMFRDTVSNANSKLSMPYVHILRKIKDFFNKTIGEQMENEILRLRRLNIDQVTNEIIGFSNKILQAKDESDYWYYYYITANVVLEGKLVKQGTKQISKMWEMSSQINTNSTSTSNSSNINRILKPGEDKNYDELLLKDEEYSKLFDFYRLLTLNELKNFSLGVEQHHGNSSTLMKLFANHHYKKSKYSDIVTGRPTLREWIGGLKRNQIELRDFEPNVYLFNAIKNTHLFEKLKFLPKGVIHHLHWSAAFYLNDIMTGIGNLMTENYKKNLITVIIKSDIYLEDKTRPESFNDIPSPRIFIIEDFINFLENFNKGNYKKEIDLFKDNYVLGDGRCILNPIAGNVKINSDLKAFLFLKKCKNSLIYSKSIDTNIKINLVDHHRIRGFDDLVIFLKNQSHILEEEINLQNDFLPNSYRDLLYTVKDQLSVAVWFKFEMIFGIYSELFDNTNVFKKLSEILVEDLQDDHVIGAEYRQSYDIGRNNSRMEILKNIKTIKNEPFPTSFILPGRKLRKFHKLRDLISNLEIAKEKKDDQTVGFDFFGYEDDPFTGARNFFPLSIKKIFEEKEQPNPTSNKTQHNSTSSSDSTQEDRNNDFAFMLNSLRKGHKLYLHAGETMYFPNYPIANRFIKKFYINDNLIHAALLPNVARVGHGFAVNNNELLMNIYKKKGISLEICPTSNQALQYYDVWDSPIINLLRKGLSVSVSPDDPGLFFYSGVRMDWFNLIMQTNLKPSEYYLLIRNSILNSSIKQILEKKEKYLEETMKNLKKFFEDDKILKEQLRNYDMIKMKKALYITEQQKKKRLLVNNEKRNIFLRNIQKNSNKLFKTRNNPHLNIYDIKDLLDHTEDYSNNKKSMKSAF